MSLKYKIGDIVQWRTDRGTTAVITEIRGDRYMYEMLTPVVIYGRGSWGSSGIKSFDTTTDFLPQANKIWKELNEN